MTATKSQPIRVVEPFRAWGGYHWREVWTHRELLYFFMLRDITIRYRQTAIGVAWAILQPLTLMCLFAFAFGRIGRPVTSNVDAPYNVFVLSGLIPWICFSTTINAAAQSVVSNAPLVTKTAFPRILIPLSAIGTALLDFVIALGVFVCFAMWHGVTPSWRVILALPFALAMAASSLGFGLIFAALAVRYRDFRFLVPFILQIGLYTSPIVYPAWMIPSAHAWILLMNPFTGLLSGFRWALLGTQPSWWGLVIGMIWSGVAFTAGALYFRKAERAFADVI